MKQLLELPTHSEKGQTILRAALAVFAKNGFRNTDVDVVAEQAGVGRGTVYRHFGNKEELFLATAEHCLHERTKAFARRVSIDEQGEVTVAEKRGRQANPVDPSDAVEVIREIARAYVEYYHDNPEAIDIMVHERSEFGDALRPSHLAYLEAHRVRMDSFLRKAMKRGALRKFDVSQVTNAFSDLLFGSVTNGYLENGKKGLKARVESAVEVFLLGLSPCEES